MDDFNDEMGDDFNQEDEDYHLLVWPKWYDVFTYPLRPFFISSNKAKEDWMIYYKNLYKTQSPSRIVFKNLLSKYGMWKMPNPYKEGHEEFYAFHENGVFFSDIDFILSYWKNTLLKKSKPEKIKDENPGVLKKISMINSIFEQIHFLTPNDDFDISVSYGEKFKNMMDASKREVWFFVAVNNMTDLFLGSEKMWGWIKDEIHRDNLLLLCKIIYDNAPANKSNSLILAWKKAGWISDVQIKQLTKHDKTEIK